MYYRRYDSSNRDVLQSEIKQQSFKAEKHWTWKCHFFPAYYWLEQQDTSNNPICWNDGLKSWIVFQEIIHSPKLNKSYFRAIVYLTPTYSEEAGKKNMHVQK